jgi:hypothetical protein
MAFLPLVRSGGSAFDRAMTLRLLPSRTEPRGAAAATAAPAGTDVRPSLLTDDVLVASARNLAYALPLGHAPLPLSERRRGGWSAALRRLEQALVAVAARHDLAVDVDAAEPAESLVRRLSRSHAIAPAAGDAVLALLPVLRRGAAGDGAVGLEVAAVRVAERLTGYLRSRAHA